MEQTGVGWGNRGEILWRCHEVVSVLTSNLPEDARDLGLRTSFFLSFYF